MWAGNQASRLIGRITDKLWGKEREVVARMVMHSFIPHSDNVHSMLGLIHPSQSTRGLFTLFVKKSLCVSEPVKVLICVLTGLFTRWLLLGLWKVCEYMYLSWRLVCICIHSRINWCVLRLRIPQWGLFWSLNSLVDWAVQQLHTETPCLLIYSHPQLIWGRLICSTDKFSVFASCGICLILSK